VRRLLLTSRRVFKEVEIRTDTDFSKSIKTGDIYFGWNDKKIKVKITEIVKSKNIYDLISSFDLKRVNPRSPSIEYSIENIYSKLYTKKKLEKGVIAFVFVII
jgi:ASC-1-like (ASCH) protein